MNIAVLHQDKSTTLFEHSEESSAVISRLTSTMTPDAPSQTHTVHSRLVPLILTPRLLVLESGMESHHLED